MSDESGETTFVFKANTKPAEASLDNFASSLDGKVIALNQGFELVDKVINKISSSFNKIVDFAKLGEEITAIGVRFEAIAAQAGLVPDQLTKGIEKAVHGTVDMEDALKAASGSIITLGSNAERIPQIFELAKKSTQLFGGSVIERFDEISMAVASGNTRTLKQIGLIVDADKAYEKYANQIKIAKDDLSEAQKQQALLNEVLSKGNEKFKNITSSITPLSEETKKLSVAFGEMGDSIALVINKSIGPSLQTFAASFTGAFNNVASRIKEVFLGEMPAVEEQISRIQARIKDIENLKGFDPAMFEQRKAELALLKEQLLVQESIKFQQDTKEAGDQREILTLNAKGEAHKKTNEEKKRELELLRSAQIEYEKFAESLATFENFKDGFMSGIKSMSQSVMQLGKQLATTFVNGLTNSFASIGRALAKGENVLDAFASSMLGVLGDLALQMSAFFMAQGIALLFSVGGTAQGVALIAAAAGLAVVGGALKAISGGGGGVPSGSATNPSYTSDVGGSSGTEFNQPEDRAKAETGVTVVVQGNIFDSRETGLQIAQILNDSFDLNGTIVRANA